MKRFLSFCVSTIILCSSIFIPTVHASSVQENNDDVNFYDGIYYSGNVTVDQIISLPESQKVVLREDDNVLMSIDKQNGFSNNNLNSSMPSTFSDIPSSDISSTLTSKRNADGSRLTFSLFVDWIIYPNVYLKDKIALSWSGGDALVSDSCKVKNINGAYTSSSRCSRSTVTPAAGISYDIMTGSIDTGYLLTATIANKKDGDEYKNYLGGYAHKTFGISDIGVGFGYDTITFSANFDTIFQEMEPVYSIYI